MSHAALSPGGGPHDPRLVFLLLSGYRRWAVPPLVIFLSLGRVLLSGRAVTAGAARTHLFRVRRWWRWPTGRVDRPLAAMAAGLRW